MGNAAGFALPVGAAASKFVNESPVKGGASLSIISMSYEGKQIHDKGEKNLDQINQLVDDKNTVIPNEA